MTHHSATSSDEEQYSIVTVSHVVSDQGTIVVFDGEDADGKSVRFAADHRQAADIIQALAFLVDNAETLSGDVTVAVPSWAILGVAV